MKFNITIDYGNGCKYAAEVNADEYEVFAMILDGLHCRKEKIYEQADN